MHRFKDAKSQHRKRRQGGVKRGAYTIATSRNLIGAGIGIFVLIGIGPHPLGVLSQDTGYVLDLIHYLPLELHVVQTNVGRIDRSFLQTDRAVRLTKGLDVMRAKCTCTGIGQVVIRIWCSIERREICEEIGVSDRLRDQRALVNGIRVLVAITIKPRLFGNAFDVEVAILNGNDRVISHQVSVVDKQIFNCSTRHSSVPPD